MKRTRWILIALFSLFLATLAWGTLLAVRDRAIGEAGNLFQDPWFNVTLLDAYLGFCTVYLWIAYKTPSLVGRVLWFVLVMTLGNFAISTFCLIQLIRWHDGRWETLLLRNP